MARRSVKEAAGEPEELELQITPLIDVVFLLLVFFLTSINFRTMEGFLQANIPEAAPSTPAERDETVTIILNAQGGTLNIKVNTIDLNDQYSAGSIIELYDALDKHLGMVKETFVSSGKEMPLVTIDAHQALLYKYVLAALNVCTKHKITNLSFLLPE